ncbi:uncharacterized protein LOC111561429 [Felis catus]|uniref:uncharacterized protein LOC111561429 n=1 Tax=Felis catus TaxID=9685 RepID=UPI001D19A244|nr:uncharacterized protein LOC111561429 [Felis catus]XP_044918178.1 uncharacterized protein LOC111561429 [Felis catus]XP_044918179.1 uncharacterized protein LOC111561429 [Felis catus]
MAIKAEEKISPEYFVLLAPSSNKFVKAEQGAQSAAQCGGKIKVNTEGQGRITWNEHLRKDWRKKQIANLKVEAFFRETTELRPGCEREQDHAFSRSEPPRVQEPSLKCNLAKAKTHTNRNQQYVHYACYTLHHHHHKSQNHLTGFKLCIAPLDCCLSLLACHFGCIPGSRCSGHSPCSTVWNPVLPHIQDQPRALGPQHTLRMLDFFHPGKKDQAWCSEFLGDFSNLNSCQISAAHLPVF